MPLVAFDAGGKGPPTLQVALGLKIFHLRQSTKPLAATHAHFKKCIKIFFFFLSTMNSEYNLWTIHPCLFNF